MIKQDISEKQANFVYLSIGSNLGDRLANIESTKKLLILNKERSISLNLVVQIEVKKLD